MTKRERIEQDVLHRRAQVAVLSGLAVGDDVYGLMVAAAASHVPGWFTPDVALWRRRHGARRRQPARRRTARVRGTS